MTPKSRENDLVVQNVNDELFIYDLKTDQVYSLNTTSAFIWNNLDGETSVSDLTRKTGKQFNQPVGEDLILLAIDNFRQANLLEEETAPKPLSKLKRREAIKRIGLATMIALPVISMLVAPTALHAASGGNTAVCQPCTGTNGSQGTCAPGLRCQTQQPPGPMLCGSNTGYGNANNTSQTGYRAGVNYGTQDGYNSSTCADFGRRFCCRGSATFTAPSNCICN